MARTDAETTSSRRTTDKKDPRAARDVPPGASWAFTDHRSMAEVLAEERKTNGKEK